MSRITRNPENIETYDSDTEELTSVADEDDYAEPTDTEEDNEYKEVINTCVNVLETDNDAILQIITHIKNHTYMDTIYNFFNRRMDVCSLRIMIEWNKTVGNREEADRLTDFLLNRLV